MYRYVHTYPHMHVTTKVQYLISNIHKLRLHGHVRNWGTPKSMTGTSMQGHGLVYITVNPAQICISKDKQHVQGFQKIGCAVGVITAM